MGRPIRIQKGNITAHGGSSNGHSTGGLGGTGSGLIEVTGAFFTSLTGLDSTITVSTANGMFISKQKVILSQMVLKLSLKYLLHHFRFQMEITKTGILILEGTLLEMVFQLS